MFSLLVAIPAREIKLAFVYGQLGSSWLIESHSQFKLAVKQINAEGLVNLSYVSHDSQGRPANALLGVVDGMNDPDVVGIVGTGYTSALGPAALLSSIQRLPMVSPGSTGLSLSDKTDMPFLLRSVPSDESSIVKLIDTITAFGWQNIGVVFHDPDFEDDKDNFELKATMAGINVVMSVGIPGEFDASQSWRTSLPLSLLQASGARIVVAFLRTSPLDLGWLPLAEELGLLAKGYATARDPATTTLHPLPL